MTRLRGWIAANLAILTGAIVTGVHVGRNHGSIAGFGAFGIFLGFGLAALIYALIWHGLRKEKDK